MNLPQLTEAGERVLQDALAQLPEDQRTGFDTMFRFFIAQRERFGLPLKAEGLTMQEQIDGEGTVAVRVGRELIDEYRGTRSLTAKEFMHRWWGEGCHNRDLPWVALNVILCDALPLEEERILVDDAWVGPEFPEANADRGMWVAVFERVGWLSDCDETSSRPAGGTRTLYRGSTRERKRGLAWTGDLERAQWFADRFNGVIGEALVWTCEVPDDRLLARFIGRGEDEWVANVKGLKVKRCGE